MQLTVFLLSLVTKIPPRPRPSCIVVPTSSSRPHFVSPSVSAVATSTQPKQREQSTLGTCPSLLGPYLRTFNVLEARPTYRLLQTYSLVSVLLREVPVARVSSAGEDGTAGGNSAGQALIMTVMPAALNKKELTRGVLSGNSLLQAVTMDLMASILDRARRVATAAAAAVSSPQPSPTVAGELTSLLRQRMPEVQTLLSLRDKIGGGGGGSDGGVRVVALKWRLLSLLDRYARVLPAAVAATRFDFLKLLPSALAPPAPAEASSSSGGAVADVHPLVQLVTLQLLSREGVVVGGVQQSSGSSGWLSHKAAAGTGDAAGATQIEKEAAEKTPLGMVLRVVLDPTTSPATRAAARALAARALVSLGVVPPPQSAAAAAGRERGGFADSKGGGEVDGAPGEVVVDGEAGVWLDVLALNPGAVGVLVVLVRRACEDAHALMAAGIRAAEKGMKENRFLRSAAGGSGGDADDPYDEGEWEVEFRCALSFLGDEE